MTCIEGELSIKDDTGNEVKFRQGESVLIPANLRKFSLCGKGKIVDAFN